MGGVIAFGDDSPCSLTIARSERSSVKCHGVGDLQLLVLHLPDRRVVTPLDKESFTMTDENQNQQLELDFPDPDDFPSYDETDPADGQAELPDDSFEAAAVSVEEGCGCVQ